MEMDDRVKSYLMNCDLDDLSDTTMDKYEKIGTERMNTEKYWRDRISAENQS